MMRIGFITCHYPPDSIGGGQMQSMRLCKSLSIDHEVKVFTRSYDSSLPGIERDGNYILIRRRMNRIPLIRSIVDLIKGLAHISKYKNETDLFLSFHIQLAALMVILGKTLFGIKAGVSPRGLEDFDFNGFKKYFQQFIYRNADLILIQSESIKTIFVENASANFSRNALDQIISRIRILPNGINVPDKVPSRVSERPHQIVFVGRLEKIKGINFLVEAFKKVDQRYQLVIIGEGSQRMNLEELSQGFNVRFMGQCSIKQIHEMLSNSRILILPSISENFPNVILEAFCNGVPVIATRVGAIPELIQNNINGLLVNPSNSLEIYYAIIKILENESELDLMGACSYRSAYPYDWKNITGNFETVITKTDYEVHH